jgi:hypothetical protein
MAAPVSSTQYVPLYRAAPVIRTRVPIGRTAGSAATMPFETGMPDAVIRPVQYAVAVNRNDPAGRGAACVAGACGGGCSGGGCAGGGCCGGGVCGAGAG